MIEYLSPSSISLWDMNQEKFYCQYLAKYPVPRMKQTLPMAIGSEFDRLVKNKIQKSIGVDIVDYSEQVDVSYRSEPLLHEGGEYLLSIYFPYVDKLLALGNPLFYDDGIFAYVNGCPLFGKPDFVIPNKLILDWKVNGFFSHASPKRGYVFLDGDTHYKTQLIMHPSGNLISCHSIDSINNLWGLQLCIYKWLVTSASASASEDICLGLDQLVCDSRNVNIDVPVPCKVRVAVYRGLISKKFSDTLFDRVGYIWDVINSDHIFRGMSKMESQNRCAILDECGRGAIEMADVL